VRATVLRPVLAMQRGAADRVGRYSDAARLRAERDSLAAYLVGQATLAAENRELRGLLGFRERLAYSFVPAEGRWMAGPGSDGMLRLSAGRRDRLTDGAAVITAEGLAGQAAEKGAWLIEQLRGLGSGRVREVRGLGLMVGVEMVDPDRTDHAGRPRGDPVTLPTSERRVRRRLQRRVPDKPELRRVGEQRVAGQQPHGVAEGPRALELDLALVAVPTTFVRLGVGQRHGHGVGELVVLTGTAVHDLHLDVARRQIAQRDERADRQGVADLG